MVGLAEAAGVGMRIFLQPFSWVKDLLTGDRNSVIKVAIKFKEQGRSRRRRIRLSQLSGDFVNRSGRRKQ